MFQLNKNSSLVTVSSDVKLADLKSQLVDEGFYLGYYPLDEVHYSINYYLNRRIINFYHFAYGSLSDLVSSIIFELKDGKSFHLKDAPRSAIGPDFNRMIVGSKNTFGTIKTVTLKVCSLPEKISHGIVILDSRDQAKAFVQSMIGQFIALTYFKYNDIDQTAQNLDLLKIKAEASESLMFSLSGLHEIVSVQKEIVEDYCKKNHLKVDWIKNKQSGDVINQILHQSNVYREIKEQYRSFLWTAPEVSSHLTLEKDFLNHV